MSDLREEVEQNNFLQQKPKELSNLIQEEIEEPAQENKEEGRAESVEKKNLNNRFKFDPGFGAPLSPFPFPPSPFPLPKMKKGGPRDLDRT